MAASIFASGSPWRFAHPLIRTAVYAQIPKASRALAHGQAAALLGSGRYEESLEVLSRAAEAASVAHDDDLALRIEVQRVSIQLDIDPPRALGRLERYENRLATGSPTESLWLAERAMWGAFAD